MAGIRKALVAANVVHEELLGGRAQEQIDAEDGRLRSEVEKTCEAVRALGIEADGHLLGGNPAREILRAAEDLDCTLVLMGDPGEGRLSRVPARERLPPGGGALAGLRGAGADAGRRGRRLLARRRRPSPSAARA